jgi:hypothetical protein
VFVEESDCIVPVSGERAISFVRFISLAIEFHLFDLNKTKHFSEVSSQEVSDLFKICKKINFF